MVACGVIIYDFTIKTCRAFHLALTIVFLKRLVVALRECEWLLVGKTSRWAIAWSFTVSPALASQPIRRLPTSRKMPIKQQNTSESAGRSSVLLPASRDTNIQPGKLGPVRRCVSFDVKAHTAAGIKLLQCLVGLLNARGAECTVVESSLTVTAIPRHGIGTGPLSIQFTLQQQESAVYVVTASIAATSVRVQCRAFMQLVQDIKCDVLQVWQST